MRVLLILDALSHGLVNFVVLALLLIVLNFRKHSYIAL